MVTCVSPFPAWNSRWPRHDVSRPGECQKNRFARGRIPGESSFRIGLRIPVERHVPFPVHGLDGDPVEWLAIAVDDPAAKGLPGPSRNSTGFMSGATTTSASSGARPGAWAVKVCVPGGM